MGSDERPDATVLMKSLLRMAEEVHELKTMNKEAGLSRDKKVDDCLRLSVTIHEQSSLLLAFFSTTNLQEGINELRDVKLSAEDVVTSHAMYGREKAAESLPGKWELRETILLLCNGIGQRVAVDLETQKQLIEYSKKKLGMGSAVRDLTHATLPPKHIKAGVFRRDYEVSKSAFYRALEEEPEIISKNSSYPENELEDLARRKGWPKK